MKIYGIKHAIDIQFIVMSNRNILAELQHLQSA